VSGWGFSGVFGAGESELGVGVLGTNFSNTGVSYGVHGATASEFGTGIFGQGGSAGVGVVGDAGTGVEGVGDFRIWQPGVSCSSLARISSLAGGTKSGL
jgi:hypothetical protein